MQLMCAVSNAGDDVHRCMASAFSLPARARSPSIGLLVQSKVRWFWQLSNLRVRCTPSTRLPHPLPGVTYCLPEGEGSHWLPSLRGGDAQAAQLISRPGRLKVGNLLNSYRGSRLGGQKSSRAQESTNTAVIGGEQGEIRQLGQLAVVEILPASHTRSAQGDWNCCQCQIIVHSVRRVEANTMQKIRYGMLQCFQLSRDHVSANATKPGVGPSGLVLRSFRRFFLAGLCQLLSCYLKYVLP
jgi:hypothetical protein